MGEAAGACPWHGFAMYFPGVEFDDSGVEHQLATYFYSHFSGPEPFPPVRLPPPSS